MNNETIEYSIKQCLTLLVLASFTYLGYLAANTAYLLLINYHFTSDGFHYYSAIRNFSFHLSTHEGPVFEYLLGNHGYFTTFLLAPFVRLFSSPYVMAFTTVASHFATGVILFLCGIKVIHSNYRYLTSALVALLYVIHPLVVSGYFADVYMFQPDYLLAPQLALLFYVALIKNSKTQTLLLTAVGASIILTKEEYIPFIPIYIIFVLSYVWFLSSNHSETKKTIAVKFIKSMGALLLIALLIVAVMTWFRTQNIINHAVRGSFHYSHLISLEAYKASFNLALTHLKVISPIIVLGLLIKPRAAFLLCLFWLLAFTTGRFLLNHILYYGNANGVSWGNVVIAPTIFISIIFLMGLLSQQYSSRTFAIMSTFSLTICITISANLNIQSITYNKILSSINNEIKPRFSEVEVQQIRSKIPRTKKMVYSVTEEYMIAPFMDRSHVSASWITHQTAARRNKIFSEAEFIILKKENPLLQEIATNHPHMITALETNNFILIKNK